MLFNIPPSRGVTGYYLVDGSTTMQGSNNKILCQHHDVLLEEMIHDSDSIIRTCVMSAPISQWHLLHRAHSRQ